MHTHMYMDIHIFIYTLLHIHTHIYIRYIHRYDAHITITHPYTLNDVHLHIHICIRIHIYIHDICIYSYTYVHSYMDIHILDIYTHTCIYILYIHIHKYYKQLSTHTYKYTYITYYIYTHIYIHIFIHSFIHVYSCKHTYFLHKLHTLHTHTRTYIFIHICIHYMHIHTYILNITFKHSCFFNFRLFPPLPLLYLLSSPHYRRHLFSTCCFCPRFAAFGLVLLPLFSFCSLYSRFVVAAAARLVVPLLLTTILCWGCHNYSTNILQVHIRSTHVYISYIHKPTHKFLDNIYTHITHHTICNVFIFVCVWIYTYVCVDVCL